MSNNKTETEMSNSNPSSEPGSPGQNSSESEAWWNESKNSGTTRSPPESPRESFMHSELVGRRLSLNLPQEMLVKLAQRRASLEKLQVGKVSPWMHLYDFTDEKETSE